MNLGMADIRHVYAHPTDEAIVRQKMRQHGLDGTAELHIDPSCPPGKSYWLDEPLREVPGCGVTLPNADKFADALEICDAFRIGDRVLKVDAINWQDRWVELTPFDERDSRDRARRSFAEMAELLAADEARWIMWSLAKHGLEPPMVAWNT